ncbi:contractile injection system protein, VgrG/Pvc8 family [Pseudomonas huanghezhanensis]|uniref:contractile injection system protein, VgrG/Pvc8 family n=1 Tax=Pseudomonas huanghezhanensis TaxID=3002903 RepID=UPI002285AFF2|nr:contractile injection system protein, VgrG/Pvc8 family [Pseudomonas sp. BSw22131]
MPIPQDKQGPLTLAINDSQMDLRVVGFSGHEALNQPYRFDVDLVSRHPDLDCASLRGISAYLAFGAPCQGIHGCIDEALLLHAGTSLSLYRVTLVPGLMRLAEPRSRRTFNGMSVPQIISHLLEDGASGGVDYRFDPISGVYPAREHCVQYRENSLHLLQRLCEEEGISFRFEHTPGGHTLIFGDDPATFPALMQSRAVKVISPQDDGEPGITHLAEQFAIRPSYSSHACRNQPSASHTAQQRQISARTLERLRCERRVIKGRSNQPALVSGQIMQVGQHPDRLMNDQWLLTEIRHEGIQLSVLKGGDRQDIAAIVQATLARRTLRSGCSLPISAVPAGTRISTCRYQNEFAVLPWAMPFRPSLDHPKPAVSDTQVATLTAPQQSDAPGRLRLRFDWQPACAEKGGEDSWARLCRGVDISPETTAVAVRFFEDDPDQPLICGIVQRTLVEQAMLGSSVSSGVDNETDLTGLRLAPGEHLTLRGTQTLQVRTSQATLELAPDRLTFSALTDA